MRANFGWRRRMYGDAVVGERMIGLIELARSLGFAAKFTGSGGAVVCIRDLASQDGTGAVSAAAAFDLSQEEENSVARAFEAHGFEFTKILPAVAL
mmetsp:Transcript_45861/g.103581  ORF Transcript_45861/g.103581 Transcript_45861/m.103581 type:complete len:96 (+) Transcript_45861:702-989(+)